MLKFTDCSIYLKTALNVRRIDVREVTIEEGQQFAQYTDAVRVVYLEKGKRKPRGLWLTYKPFLVILDRSQAFDPDKGLVVVSSTENVTVSQSRYSSFDERWVTDFTEQLAARKTTPLYQRVA